MIIYWYKDIRDRLFGTHSEFKRDKMAEQNYAEELGECDISELPVECKLIDHDWIPPAA
jgi:hypothetical protein